MKIYLQIALLLLATWAFPQTVTISGTVADANSCAYANGSGSARLVPQNQQWLVNGTNPVQSPIPINALDSFGHFSIQLTNTSLISPASANPQWQFSFCSQSFNGQLPVCFTMNALSLTTSQDITSTIHSQTAPIPNCGGTSSLSLQTNGVTNGDQTLLNLQQGTGVTLTDNGTGTVTITSNADNKWSSLTDPTGALILDMGTNVSFFEYGPGVLNPAFAWISTDVATISNSVSSPSISLTGQYWNGSGSAGDGWSFQDVIGNGTNGTSTLDVQHQGTSGTSLMSVPGFLIRNIASGTQCVQADGSGVLSGTGSSCFTLPVQYTKLRCETGLGDGLNAVTAGTYLQSFCYNDSGVTWTITGIKCFTDNSGTSTLNATNGSNTALLTGAITCSSAFASGIQSGTTTIANGDYVKFTFVADGTSKQSTWVVSLSQ